MKKTFTSLCASFHLVASLNASESKTNTKTPEKPVNLAKIAEFTLSPDGYLDKKLHRLFWSQIKDEQNLDQVKSILVDSPKMQIMIWESIKESIKSGKVKYVAGLAEELSRMKNVPGLAESTMKMIESAAKGKPFRIDSENNVVFTLPMTQHFINQWKSASERGEALFDKNFSFEKIEQRLSDTLSLNWVFMPEERELNIMYGNRAYPSKAFGNRVNKNDYILVSETKNTVKEKDKALRSCVDGFFKTMGYFDKVKIIDGKNTAFGMSTFVVPNDTEKKPIFSAIGCEYRNGRVYGMIANSMTQESAARLFSDLAHDLHIKKIKE